MIKLSVVISAFNEEKKIEECLKSTSFADEVILVDNGSTDKTLEIAKKFNIKIFNQKNNLSKIDLQKNFGFEKATGQWILSLDADERVSEDLQEEIESTINNQQSEINGYWIPRRNIIFNKWIEHSGWYPDLQLRLFKKGKGEYRKEVVHHPIDIEGETSTLNNFLIHKHYSTVKEFVEKTVNIYAPSEAEKLIKEGYKISVKDALRFPAQEFIRRFFAREGYKDGLHGLVLSLLMAFYHFFIFVNVWEKSQFREEDDVLAETEVEFKKITKEFNHWFLAAVSQNAGTLKKIYLKSRQKIVR